jgi:hypothetical protein
MNEYYVYIMASKSQVLYIGMTNDIDRRVAEHQSCSLPGFASKYQTTRLLITALQMDPVPPLLNGGCRRQRRWRRLIRAAAINSLVRGIHGC